MIKGNSGYTFPIAVTLIGVLIFSVASATGCSRSSEFAAPEFTEPDAAAIEVTPEQLYVEYTEDEAAASAKYNGKRLSFIGVTAEKVNNEFYDSRATNAEFYVLVDYVKFRPSYGAYIDDVRVGFVLDIVGEVMGLISGSLYVNDCWIQIVEGDGGGPVEPRY
ncbi:MAG: OB-fold protein [Planctomycetota bacterium]|jgi:hypothetical protein